MSYYFILLLFQSFVVYKLIRTEGDTKEYSEGNVGLLNSLFDWILFSSRNREGISLLFNLFLYLYRSLLVIRMFNYKSYHCFRVQSISYTVLTSFHMKFVLKMQRNPVTLLTYAKGRDCWRVGMKKNNITKKQVRSAPYCGKHNVIYLFARMFCYKFEGCP